LQEVTLSQGARLQALDDKAGLEDFVNVWLSPLLSPKTVSKREKDLWALLQRGSIENSPQLAQLLPSVEEMQKSPLIALLRMRLPHLSNAEIVFRHDAIMSGLGGLIRATGNLPTSKQSAADLKDFVSRWVLSSLRG
jgi:hypothetical protein